MTAPRTKIDFPPEFVDQFAGVIYTSERVERARSYLATRGLDMSRFNVQWTMTEADPAAFEFVRRWNRSPRTYAETLYIPVEELRYPPPAQGKIVLSGFDMRYCGSRPDRAKFVKLKREPKAVMLYNVHEAMELSRETGWAVVVESAIDAETLRMLDMPVVSPLTALGTPEFTMLLYGLFDRVLLMYDNDDGGEKATKRILDHAAHAGPAVLEAFKSVAYSGEDPNQALLAFGPSILRQTILSQSV